MLIMDRALAHSGRLLTLMRRLLSVIWRQMTLRVGLIFILRSRIARKDRRSSCKERQTGAAEVRAPNGKRRELLDSRP